MLRHNISVQDITGIIMWTGYTIPSHTYDVPPINESQSDNHLLYNKIQISKQMINSNSKEM